MAKNSSALNMVACTHRTLNEVSTYDSFDTQPYDGQLLSLSDLDEKELDGSSEMVYDSSISSDGTTLELSFEGQMDTSSKFESKCEHITDSIVVGNMVDSSSYDQANVLRIENENKDLKIQIQQNLGKISSFEKRATEFASMRDELDQKTAELNGMRINFAEIKKANEASHQKLLADNLSLRTAQTDSVTSNYTAEKKCASLEVMRVDLIQQVNFFATVICILDNFMAANFFLIC